VVDASVLVDLLAGTDYAAAAATRLRGQSLHAPASCDAEVLSALGRLHRADQLTVGDVDAALARLEVIPMQRHPLPGLLVGAWARRAELLLTDALYVELAAQLDIPVVTTDQRLARACPVAEAIGP
jgi:predicted nucleic acid-binding protein